MLVRRLLLLGLWGLPAVSAAQSPPSPATLRAGVTVRDSLRTYHVEGATGEALRASILAHAPLHEGASARFVGLTTWRMESRYTYQDGPAECAVTGAAVAVDVHTTLPVWAASARARPTVARRWRRLLGALREHEAGHRAHAVQAAHTLHDALLQLGGPSCRTLHALAGEVTARILAEAEATDRAYDAATRHGATQGASIYVLTGR